MKDFAYKLGKTGTLTFKLEDTLVLTATWAGQTYALRFLDGVGLDNTIPGRCSTAKNVPVFTRETTLEQRDNTLLTASRIAPGVWVRNRFTVHGDKAVVDMETWVEADGPVYDAALMAGKVKLDPTGFTELGGGDAGRFFPIDPCPPHYGFKGHMILRGENRFLQVEGGFLWHDHGMIDAHFQSANLNDDITWFTEDNPLRTRYAFEKTQPRAFCVEAPTGTTAPSGAVVSGALRAEYALLGEGAAFLCKGTPYPMAVMLVRNNETGAHRYLDTLRGWASVTVTENKDGPEFFFGQQRGIPGIGLRISAKICPENRIEWTVEALNSSSCYTVIWCSYPRLRYAADRVLDFFHPYGGGDVEIGFNRTDGYKASPYPAGLMWSMAYMTAYPTGSREDMGIYYAVHDPKGGFKNFTGVTVGGVLQFTCKYCAENLGEPGNGFTLPGVAVWQAYRGDWFDATEIYRAFAETAPWMPRDNSRTPLWMQELPFWIMDWMPNERDTEEPIPISIRPSADVASPTYWIDAPLKLRQELGVPFGYHLYNWHGNPFNNDFPHFFPPKKALAAGLEKLKAAGIRMMPYINAMLWDQRDKDGVDYQFTSVALPHAVKRENGLPPQLTYSAHEPDGEKTKLSPMCPTSRVWREKVKENVLKCFELGMDAVYMDQTAAHGPHPCMDKTHNHAPGGGSWWSENQREMIAEIRRVMPADKVLTSEGTAEVYSGVFDGLLGWAWIVVDHYVPAFMRVYGGKVAVFGRNANGYMKDTDTYWKYHLAQSLVAGEQMGWINSDFVYKENRLHFARKLIRFRYENREFFRSARPMRPPEAVDAERFATGIGMQWQGVLWEPYITVGALENGSRRMLLAVNLSDGERTEKIWFRGEEFGLRRENLSVTGEGTAQWLDENHLRLTIPANSLICVNWEV